MTAYEFCAVKKANELSNRVFMECTAIAPDTSDIKYF